MCTINKSAPTKKVFNDPRISFGSANVFTVNIEDLEIFDCFVIHFVLVFFLFFVIFRQFVA